MPRRRGINQALGTQARHARVFDVMYGRRVSESSYFMCAAAEPRLFVAWKPAIVHISSQHRQMGH